MAKTTENTEMYELLKTIADVVTSEIGMSCNENARASLVRELAMRLHRDGWRKYPVQKAST